MTSLLQKDKVVSFTGCCAWLCVSFRVKAVMCHCQCNMFSFLFLSPFLPLSTALLGTFLALRHLRALFSFFTSASEREKGTSSVPLEPLVFQRGSIHLSPCKQRKPQATNDLLVYLFQYFRWLVYLLIGHLLCLQECRSL